MDQPGRRRLLPAGDPLRRPVPRGHLATEALDEQRRIAWNTARGVARGHSRNKSPTGQTKALKDARAVDGSECRWARVLAFEPPDRVVFSWDISPQWQIESDPDNTSEVEVRFIAESPTRTRIELEHRHLDRHGPSWPAVRDGVGHDEGWPLYLTRYAALFSQGS